MNRIVAILLGVLFGVLLVLAVWVLLTLPRSEKQTSRFHVAHLTVTQRRAVADIEGKLHVLRVECTKFPRKGLQRCQAHREVRAARAT